MKLFLKYLCSLNVCRAVTDIIKPLTALPNISSIILKLKKIHNFSAEQFINTYDTEVVIYDYIKL